MIVYFSSKTGNTKKFVSKLDFENSLEISKDLILQKPYILVLPTYAKSDGTKALHKSVVTFLNANHKLIKGVVAGGNRNFGRYFGYAGDIIQYKCNVEILHKFELCGSEYDVDITRKRIKEIMNDAN